MITKPTKAKHGIIYALRWDNAVYIGQTVNLKSRLSCHRRHTRFATSRLYRHWRKHGKPHVEVLAENIPVGELTATESEYIERYRHTATVLNQITYTPRPVFDDEHRANMSVAITKAHKRPEVKARHRAATKACHSRRHKTADFEAEALRLHKERPDLTEKSVSRLIGRYEEFVKNRKKRCPVFRMNWSQSC